MSLFMLMGKKKKEKYRNLLLIFLTTLKVVRKIRLNCFKVSVDAESNVISEHLV